MKTKKAKLGNQIDRPEIMREIIITLHYIFPFFSPLVNVIMQLRSQYGVLTGVTKMIMIDDAYPLFQCTLHRHSDRPYCLDPGISVDPGIRVDLGSTLEWTLGYIE